MEKKRVVAGDVFIVPNPSERLFEFFEPEWQMEKLRRLAGVLADYEDIMIQTRITSPECDNWQDEFGGFQKTAGLEVPNDSTRKGRLMGYYPEYFPKKIFEGKKEGDKIRLECKDVIIELTCNQLNHKYRRFGRFEDVLKLVC